MMTKEEFIATYNRPEFVQFEQDLDMLIDIEIALFEVRKLNAFEKLLIKGEENYD